MGIAEIINKVAAANKRALDGMAAYVPASDAIRATLVRVAIKGERDALVAAGMAAAALAYTGVYDVRVIAVAAALAAYRVARDVIPAIAAEVRGAVAGL